MLKPCNTYWVRAHFKRMFTSLHMAHVMCHMSCVTFHISCVTCPMARVTYDIFYLVLDFVDGGSFINGASPCPDLENLITPIYKCTRLEWSITRRILTKKYLLLKNGLKLPCGEKVDFCHVTHERWHTTDEIWHLTPDTWRL